MSRLLAATLLPLTLLAVAVATHRAFVVADTRSMPVAVQPQIYPTDSAALQFLARGRNAGPAERQRLRESFIRGAARYVSHPAMTYLHMLPAIVLVLLAPLQLVKVIRDRNIRYHRWNGRVVLACGIGVAISAVYFGVINPHIPRIEPPAILAIAGSFVLCGIAGFRAIRRGDTERHREWMLRMYAIALSIATVRFVDYPLQVLFVRIDHEVLQVASFWLGWALTLLVIEGWIRYTRQPIVTWSKVPGLERGS